MSDYISRQAAIDALKNEQAHYAHEDGVEIFDEYNHAIKSIEKLPSIQPTLYGYNIKHLELIASVLQKEDIPPDRVTEMLTDIGRIVAIVADEFEESLRKAVEQCTI